MSGNHCIRNTPHALPLHRYPPRVRELNRPAVVVLLVAAVLLALVVLT